MVTRGFRTGAGKLSAMVHVMELTDVCSVDDDFRCIGCISLFSCPFLDFFGGLTPSLVRGGSWAVTWGMSGSSFSNGEWISSSMMMRSTDELESEMLCGGLSRGDEALTSWHTAASYREISLQRLSSSMVMNSLGGMKLSVLFCWFGFLFSGGISC